jgi:hypothetical protein
MRRQQLNSYVPYQSDYANQLHQVTVSVSKHLFVTKTGRLRYQKKPMDARLEKVSKDSKDHVVHYLIRDHFSGVFYAELYSSLELVPIEEFLFRAWSLKDAYPFCGVPDYISIPKTVSDAFPTVRKLIEAYGIQTVAVTSGFQSGAIRDIKTWEEHVCGEIRCEEELQLLRAWTPKRTAGMSSDLNGEYAGRQSKIYKWDYGIREAIKLPPEEGW